MAQKYQGHFPLAWRRFGVRLKEAGPSISPAIHSIQGEEVNLMNSIRTSLAALVLGLSLLPGALTAGEYYGKQKVVYHLNNDDPKQLDMALRNIQNHINAVGADNIELRVVLHGNGVSLLTKAKEDMDLQSKVINLKGQHVEFKICKNTLDGKKLSYENDLFDVSKADVVPSGVAELAKLQAEGFVYIKP